jgi:hypothetical protein
VARPRHLPSYHGELVAQDRDLYILRLGSRTAANHTEDPPQDKERQGPYHHEVILARSCITPAQGRALTLHPSPSTLVTFSRG